MVGKGAEERRQCAQVDRDRPPFGAQSDDRSHCVEVLRGDRVESAHRGSGAVVDADGRVAFAFGDVDRPIFPRSAVKAIQALPLIESGAADRLGLTTGRDRAGLRLALGRGQHVATRLRDAREGRPRRGSASNAGRTGRSARRRRGRWRPSRRNAFRPAQQLLGQARRLRLPRLRGRDRPGGLRLARSPRPARRDGGARGNHWRRRSARKTGRSTAARSRPTRSRSARWRSGFARFGRGRGFRPARARAAARIRAAVAANPRWSAGEGRFDYRGHDASWRARLHQDGRRGRLLRRPCRNSASGSPSRPTTARKRAAQR